MVLEAPHFALDSGNMPAAMAASRDLDASTPCPDMGGKSSGVQHGERCTVHGSHKRLLDSEVMGSSGSAVREWERHR